MHENETSCLKSQPSVQKIHTEYNMEKIQLSTEILMMFCKRAMTSPSKCYFSPVFKIYEYLAKAQRRLKTKNSDQWSVWKHDQQRCSLKVTMGKTRWRKKFINAVGSKSQGSYTIYVFCAVSRIKWYYIFQRRHLRNENAQWVVAENGKDFYSEGKEALGRPGGHWMRRCFKVPG